MKPKFDHSLEFRRDAINAVVEAFDGQAISQSGATASQASRIGGLFRNGLGMGNQLTLPADQVPANVQKTREANDIEKIRARRRQGSSPAGWPVRECGATLCCAARAGG